MKKLTRLTVVFLTLALLIGSLTACGSKDQGSIGKKAAPFREVYREATVDALSSQHLVGNAFQLPEYASDMVSGFQFVRYFDYVTNQYCFYNVNSDSVVLKVNKEKIADTQDLILYDDYIVVVETNGQDKCTVVYDENGKVLVSRNSDVEVSVGENGVSIDDVFLYIRDGEVKQQYHIAPFTNITSNAYTFTEQYAIYTNSSSAVFYNKDFEPVAFYEAPGESSNVSIYILETGNLLVQYTTECAPTSNRYDFVYNGVKYALHEVLFDPTRGKEKKLDIDGMICELYDKDSKIRDLDFEDIFTDNVSSVMGYYPIVDGLVDDSQARYVLLDEKGRVGAALDEYVEHQRGLILPLYNGVYYTQTANGYVLLDGNGELLQYAPNIGSARSYGYLYQNKLYNHNFEPVLDLNHSDYEIINSSSNTALFYRKTVDGKWRFFRYDQNGESEITAPTDRVWSTYSTPVFVVSGNHYYYTCHYAKDDAYHMNPQYSYYANDGTLLFHSSTSMVLVAHGEDALLMRYTDVETSQTAYIRLYKNDAA